MGRHRLDLLCGVGQAVLPCRSGMPESTLLFSVPAWGSFLWCSQEVLESKSPEFGDRKSLRKNSYGMSFRAAAGDEESRSGPGNIQGEIPRCARNDTLNQVFTRAPKAGKTTRAGGRKAATPQNRESNARMFIKTKEEYKKSGGADRRFRGLRLFDGRRVGRAAGG